ncbi:MAG: hypothetical protein LH650_12970, partial [Chloroflexi bacterium]|nr:hypothetical protein [Chloroflexota bacterium]
YKGKKPPAFKDTYTVENDLLTVTGGGKATVNCRKAADADFVSGLAFAWGLATSPGTWSVVGDTLTITSHNVPGTLVFQRITGP